MGVRVRSEIGEGDGVVWCDVSFVSWASRSGGQMERGVGVFELLEEILLGVGKRG